jgi:hypothetical protein
MMDKRRLCIWGGLAGIAGVLMIGISFAINQGPPLGVSNAQLMEFASTHFRSVMWGAWLQAVGPMLITRFALTLAFLSGAMNRVSGWLTVLGCSVLMMVSLAEVIIYISALDVIPETMVAISINVGHAIQHLYFFVAAPALFLSLAAAIWNAEILAKSFAWLAVILGSAFLILGLTSLYAPGIVVPSYLVGRYSSDLVV